MRFVDTSRLRMHCRTHGDPQGLPMLLLHGSFGSSRWWEPLFAYLPEDIYAIAPDLRGSGHSDKPDSGYDIPSLAQDVAALTDTLDLQGIDLVGHASGAAIALELTLMRPARIATLTLIGPPPLGGIVTPVEALMALEKMRTDQSLLRAGLATMAPALFTSDAPHEQALGEQLMADAADQAPAAFTEIAVGLAAWNRVQEAGTLTLPTLVMWGDQDTLVDRASVKHTLLTIPGASNLEVLRGAGHAAMLEAPYRVAERLLTFILDDYANYEAIRRRAD